MKKIKQFIVVLFVLLVFASSVIPASAEIEVEGDAYVGVSSMYLWRGFDLSDGDPVLQGGMDISFKGFTLSYWSNYSLENNELDETDIVIDYSTDLSELVSLSVGNILYALDGFEDTNEVYLGLGFKTLLEPALTIYYDHDEFSGDMFVTASVGHSLELSEGLSVSLGGLISYADNDVYSELHNYELSAGADYAVNDQISISPFVIFSDAISDEAEEVIEDEAAGGINLTLTF